jgi:transposase-like protein
MSLVKDRDALLAFYDFPAEHWDHLRTTNPIERVFATVRHRTVRTQGSLSPTTAKLMVFKLVIAASKTWPPQISCRRSSQVSDSTTASRSSKCPPRQILHCSLDVCSEFM